MTRMLIRVIGAAWLLLGIQAASAATVWDCYVYNPVATVAAVQGVIRLIDNVKQQTNGELQINLHLGGSLPINATNITAAVADSVVQIGDDGFATGNDADQRDPASADAAAERSELARRWRYCAPIST